jgi:hypothetical protein
MPNMIQPTVNSDQIAQIFARSATLRYANPEQTAMWSRDLGPNNPLAATTEAGEAQGPAQSFVRPIDQPADSFVPQISMNNYDPTLGNNVDIFA